MFMAIRKIIYLMFGGRLKDSLTRYIVVTNPGMLLLEAVIVQGRSQKSVMYTRRYSHEFHCPDIIQRR